MVLGDGGVRVGRRTGPSASPRRLVGSSQLDPTNGNSAPEKLELSLGQAVSTPCVSLGCLKPSWLDDAVAFSGLDQGRRVSRVRPRSRLHRPVRGPWPHSRPWSAQAVQSVWVDSSAHVSSHREQQWLKHCVVSVRVQSAEVPSHRAEPPVFSAHPPDMRVVRRSIVLRTGGWRGDEGRALRSSQVEVASRGRKDLPGRWDVS